MFLLFFVNFYQKQRKVAKKWTMWCPEGLGGHEGEAWATRRSPRDDFLGVRVPFWIPFAFILGAKMMPKSIKNAYCIRKKFLDGFCLNFESILVTFWIRIWVISGKKWKPTNMWILTTVHTKTLFFTFQERDFWPQHVSKFVSTRDGEKGWQKGAFLTSLCRTFGTFWVKKTLQKVIQKQDVFWGGSGSAPAPTLSHSSWGGGWKPPPLKHQGNKHKKPWFIGRGHMIEHSGNTQNRGPL